MRRPKGAAVAGFAPPLLGFAVGMTVVLTSPGRDAPLWLVWGAIAVGLCTAAGAVFVYGLRRWADLIALHPLPVGDVALKVGAIAGVGLIVVNIPYVLRGSGSDWRNGLFLMLAIVTSVPAGAVMYGVQHVASVEALPGTPGAQLVLLVALRRLLQRLLAAVGAEVALVSVQAGALFAFHSSIRAAGAHPPQYVLVVGGVGSLLVALAYVPGWSALQHCARRLCDKLFPLDDLDDASAILKRASEREKLEQILGADRSVLADMQTGLAILGPLLAGAAAAFLPH